MIDTDKHEGSKGQYFTGKLVDNYLNMQVEIKRLRRAWQILRSKTEMSCVCFTEYPDKQDINTHELMDLALKEASE